MNLAKLFTFTAALLLMLPGIARAQRPNQLREVTPSVVHRTAATTPSNRSANHHWNGGTSGTWNGHGDWCDRYGRWHRGYWGRGWDTTVIIGGFGYPFYPFGYGYGYSPFGYYPYGYGYGFGASYYSPYYRSSSGVYEGRRIGGVTNDGSVVMDVQRKLARVGLYHGAIDGVVGSGTRRAIREYERQHGLPVDGVIDQRLLATMGLA